MSNAGGLINSIAITTRRLRGSVSQVRDTIRSRYWHWDICGSIQHWKHTQTTAAAYLPHAKHTSRSSRLERNAVEHLRSNPKLIAFELQIKRFRLFVRAEQTPTDQTRRLSANDFMCQTQHTHTHSHTQKGIQSMCLCAWMFFFSSVFLRQFRRRTEQITTTPVIVRMSSTAFSC